jgi:hypothetical protein
MLSAGQITAEEAEQLIAALGREESTTSSNEGGPAHPKASARYLRVVVESSDHFGGDGPGRVNIKIPVQLLRAGVRLTSLIPPRGLELAYEALSRQGLPFDLTQIKPQHLEELVGQLHEVTVHVDQPDIKVQIFSE